MQTTQTLNKLSLSVAALGVAYGDIGTSPLYALRESLRGIETNQGNVFGVLSLIFWSLTIIISIKYMFIILNADNNGEGGVLALLTLMKKNSNKIYHFFVIIAMLGAGLLLGDGMLTPAISVVSAIEGIKVIWPTVSYAVIPLTIVILILLFRFQHNGTGKIGGYFGPIIFIWFVLIGTVGAYRIFQNPIILKAINPYYAIYFFVENGYRGYLLMGGVFLAITGGEALYADLGHFGKTPIRIAWFSTVFPCLLLCYFGQGSYLLQHHEAITNPFYCMIPSFLNFVVLIFATVTTIIASQAVISAIFSVSRQGVLLQFLPRLTIIQTSGEQRGQVYVPQINLLLAIGAIWMVLYFKNSSALAHAYGLTLNLSMLIVTCMVMYLAFNYWKWSPKKALLVSFLFIAIDVGFLGSNVQKIFMGGWIPLLIAALSAFLMYTCYKGAAFLHEIHADNQDKFERYINKLDELEVQQTDVTSIFMTDHYDKSSSKILNYLLLNGSLPKITLLVDIAVVDVPFVYNQDRFDVYTMGNNIYRLTVHYGFMQLLNIPDTLRLVNQLKILPFYLDLVNATYLIEMTLLVATPTKKTLKTFWQEKFFAFIIRNSQYDIEFYRLPYDRTLAVGTYIEI